MPHHNPLDDFPTEEERPSRCLDIASAELKAAAEQALGERRTIPIQGGNTLELRYVDALFVSTDRDPNVTASPQDLRDSGELMPLGDWLKLPKVQRVPAAELPTVAEAIDAMAQTITAHAAEIKALRTTGNAVIGHAFEAVTKDDRELACSLVGRGEKGGYAAPNTCVHVGAVLTRLWSRAKDAIAEAQKKGKA